MITVAAFYRFAPLADPSAARAGLLPVAREAGVRGSVLLAPEGVNGTIAGEAAGVAAVLGHMRGWSGFEELAPRLSEAPGMPFGRLKLRLKREIVTMGATLEPAARVGTYVDPEAWNTLIADPDVAVIDCRNDYEVALGSFDGAEDPGTARFGDWPAWWMANRERLKDRPVAMFCTGGIRCEKASAHLLANGAPQVFHLRGGILGYLEAVPAPESLWRGECFVFDDRVSVTHGLVPGTARLCHACRRPVTSEDCARPEWEEGVSCHRCADAFTPDQRARFRERQRQMRLAAARGARHMGPVG